MILPLLLPLSPQSAGHTVHEVRTLLNVCLVLLTSVAQLLVSAAHSAPAALVTGGPQTPQRDLPAHSESTILAHDVALAGLWFHQLLGGPPVAHIFSVNGHQVVVDLLDQCAVAPPTFQTDLQVTQQHEEVKSTKDAPRDVSMRLTWQRSPAE